MDESRETLDAFEEAVRMVAANLAPRWHVRFHRGYRTDVPVKVSLEHPLSAGHGWVPTREEVELCDTEPFRTVVVADPEFEHIAHAPECEHKELVKGIRSMALMFNWRNVEVRTLVGTLYDTGCLMHDECEWLAAYTGREMMAESRVSSNVFTKHDADASGGGRGE